MLSFAMDCPLVSFLSCLYNRHWVVIFQIKLWFLINFLSQQIWLLFIIYLYYTCSIFMPFSCGLCSQELTDFRLWMSKNWIDWLFWFFRSVLSLSCHFFPFNPTANDFIQFLAFNNIKSIIFVTVLVSAILPMVTFLKVFLDSSDRPTSSHLLENISNQLSIWVFHVLLTIFWTGFARLYWLDFLFFHLFFNV